MMKRSISILIVFVSLAIAAILILQENVRQRLLFFWGTDYQYVLVGFLCIGIILALVNYGKCMKWAYFFVFLPITLFPVLRCYFRLPYLFCRVCPEPCPWGQITRGGQMTKFTVPSFLVMNLRSWFWCYKLCPLGTIQDSQAMVCKYRFRLPSWLQYVRYLFLMSAILLVALTFNKSLYFQGPWAYYGSWGYTLQSLSVAAVIFTLAFFIPRFWCNYFCPIGSFSDLVLKVEDKLMKEKPLNKQDAATTLHARYKEPQKRDD